MATPANRYSFWAQLFIAIDQLLNVIPCGGYADETLSARSYRAWRDGKRPGKWLMPLIDWLFLWQATDEEVNLEAGRVVTGHCERAWWKEQLRRTLPADYRNWRAKPRVE